jgi:hypothetical protein
LAKNCENHDLYVASAKHFGAYPDSRTHGPQVTTSGYSLGRIHGSAGNLNVSLHFDSCGLSGTNLQACALSCGSLVACPGNLQINNTIHGWFD